MLESSGSWSSSIFITENDFKPWRVSDDCDVREVFDVRDIHVARDVDDVLDIHEVYNYSHVCDVAFLMFIKCIMWYLWNPNSPR